MTCNKKVLILGVASVQMDAILELKKMGYETHACAMAKDGPGADVVDYFIEINILDVEELVGYIKENQISVVYSVGSDLAIPVANLISERLNMPHFVSEETARICNNKDLMRQALGNDFNGNVNFQVIKSEEDKLNLEFPFIVKPADSQGQRGVVLVHNYDEYLESYRLAKKYSRSGLVIIEKYVSGPELSVNGYMVNGEIKYLIASDRETWPQFTGLIHKHIVPSDYINNNIENEIKEVIENACKKLQIENGPVYAQMKLEGEKPYIIEITPRLDGCHMWNLLNNYSGVNLLKLTFQHLLNNDTSELDKIYDEFNEGYVLEFICQEPNTKAKYKDYEKQIKESLSSFNYYKEDDMIRPVNGKYDKIGYFIYKK
ncbi:ATP-grasp domain-containing protein [Terrisporobacter sp.]